MLNLNNKQPVLITGMHRSGTSLISSIVEQVGVDIGVRLDKNYECKDRVRMSDQVLRAFGADWDSAEQLKFITEQHSIDSQIVKQLEKFSSRKWRWLLHPKYLVGKKAGWGWKDPRLCITLKYWK
jgi:hypothetical protein